MKLNENSNYTEILRLLAVAPRDTQYLCQSTGIAHQAMSSRLTRLRESGFIVGIGRRRIFRTAGVSYAMVWKLAAARTNRVDPEPTSRMAGRITIGRGSRWGASLV